MGRLSHLLSALVAILIVLASLIEAEAYASAAEERHLPALLPVYDPELRKDSVLQQAALQHSAMLLLFGSSEVSTGGAFNARVLFGTCPTGFAVYEVGGNSADSIIILQEIAALKSSLRGRKIVISLSPEFFLNRETPAGPYEANFLLLDANEFVFGTDIDFATKQVVARRMLEYPKTLRRDPVLAFALRNLADAGPIDRALFFAAVPLGQAHTWLLRLQNHRKALEDIAKYQKIESGLACQDAALNWEKLNAQALEMSGPYLGPNPFGLVDKMWQDFRKQWLAEKDTLNDKLFLRELRRSTEWADLDLLLGVLHELGAQPLIITLPFNGLFFDYQGVSAAARGEYYRGLRNIGTKYGVPVVTFEDHEYDRVFFTDVSHPGMKGWLYYDQVLDQFYHGILP